MAANDAMALGAIEALDAANRKALVVGINGTKEGIDAIKAGKLLASGDFNGYLQGCIGTMAAIRARAQPARSQGVQLSAARDRQHELQGLGRSRCGTRVPEVGKGHEGLRAEG